MKRLRLDIRIVVFIVRIYDCYVLEIGIGYRHKR